MEEKKSLLQEKATKKSLTPPKKPTQESGKEGFAQKYGLIIAFLVLIGIVLAPTPEGLTRAGQNTLGIMVFAIVVWSTTAISYPLSAGVIIALMAILLGFAPDANGKVIGSSAGLLLGLRGYANTAFLLVAIAMFLSNAMQQTHLDKRIALVVLSKIGAKPKHVLVGVILCGLILAFFVPSTTARTACLVPIVVGMIDAFGISMKSKFAGMLVITTAQIAGVWNIGIKTAAAQNMVAVNFIRSQLNTDITWFEWFKAAAPWAIIMSFVLYYIMLYIMPPEIEELPGGDATIKKMLADMGPVSANEIKVMVVSICLLICWVTEKTLHTIDTSTSTLIAINILMLPKIGVMTWKEIVNKINWGTIVLFGAGISLGSAILSTKAGTWLGNLIVTEFGLKTSTGLMVFVIMAIFLIIIHLGFASATGLASSMIPIVIAVLQELSDVNPVGMTMLLQYVVSFGFILPVNSPQGMLAYATETFSVNDFVRSGIPLTIIGFILLIIFAGTYWTWLGLV